MEPSLANKLVGAWEAVAGGVLMSLPWWSQLLDGVVTGAHAVAAVAGAILGAHGVYRLLKGRPVRKRDGLGE